MPTRPEICPKNPVIESFLRCPFSKISLIWGDSETEPDTGFFWAGRGAIGAQIEPELGRCGRCPNKTPSMPLLPLWCPFENVVSSFTGSSDAGNYLALLKVVRSAVACRFFMDARA